VPDTECFLESLPNDLPPAVITGLQNWHILPDHIRRAVEALLDTAEKHRTADLRITNEKEGENAND